MMLLLDTHVLLWWLDDPRQLSKAARKAIQDGTNPVYISAAVAWEIAIKKRSESSMLPMTSKTSWKPTASCPSPSRFPMLSRYGHSPTTIAIHSTGC